MFAIVLLNLRLKSTEFNNPNGIEAGPVECHEDFVQASNLNRLNNFCPYWVGYIAGKNWSLVIGYWETQARDFLTRV
jgi:hypothetical protein